MYRNASDALEHSLQLYDSNVEPQYNLDPTQIVDGR
jgi:hypothetical protein